MGVFAGQTLRVLIYARMSVDRTEGKSVRDQIRTGQSWAAREGHTVVDTLHDDGISASKFARTGRPDWESAMQMLRRGEIDCLWLWTLGRASRDRRVYLDLLEACQANRVLLAIKAKVLDPNDYSDAHQLDVDAAQAVRFSAELSANTALGVVGRVDAGEALGQAAFGYVIKYDPETGESLGRFVNPERRNVLRSIVDGLLAGERAAKIADDLTERGVPAPRGGRWTINAVRRVATNPVACGFLRHHGRLVLDENGEPRRGRHEPIVTPEEHRQLVALFERTRTGERDGQAKYLLSGIAVCGRRVPHAEAVKLRKSPRVPTGWPPPGEPADDGLVECGLPVRFSPPHGRVRKPAYVCVGFHVSRQAEPLEEFVAAVVCARLERPDARDLLLAREEPDAERQSAAEEASRLRAVLTEADARLLAGEPGVDVAWVGALRAKFRPRIEDADRRAAPKSPVVAAALEIAGPGARARWDDLLLPVRREVLRELLTPVVLPSARGAKGFDPSLVRIDWA